MPQYRVKEAAELIGVSADTLRRWVEAGRVAGGRDGAGRQVIDGADLAALAGQLAGAGERPAPRPIVSESARNRFVGLVTRVVKDTVMAQVEVQSGTHRLVSLMSREAADELGLAPGALAVASVKSTHVVVEIPAQPGEES
jgi:molybdopterin-binding protein